MLILILLINVPENFHTPLKGWIGSPPPPWKFQNLAHSFVYKLLLSTSLISLRISNNLASMWWVWIFFTLLAESL